MTALILVDLQNDFMPGGKLAVKEGNSILPIISKLLEHPFDVIVATRDWHPKNHGSFATSHNKLVGDVIELDGILQILWPEHCIQNTEGAKFHKDWDSSKVNAVFSKGVDPLVDSYSAFFDNEHKKSTGLFDFLKERQIHTIYIAGLATDYCVKYSVLDACRLGFNTFVVMDGCRGVNLQPNDSEKAFFQMQVNGAHLTKYSEIKSV